jgi:hypothetical protein
MVGLATNWQKGAAGPSFSSDGGGAHFCTETWLRNRDCISCTCAAKWPYPLLSSQELFELQILTHDAGVCPSKQWSNQSRQQMNPGKWI